MKVKCIEVENVLMCSVVEVVEGIVEVCMVLLWCCACVFLLCRLGSCWGVEEVVLWCYDV